MKKITFDQVKEKLLSLGFTLLPNKEERGIVILGVFGLNYCSCCKRCDGKITIYYDFDESDLWITGSDDGGFRNDPLTRGSFKETLRDLGIKLKDCKL